MKKRIYALALCVCLMATALVGCGKDSKEKETKEETKKTELKYTIERTDYVGIEIEESDASVTDEELQEYIDSDLMSNYTEIKEGTIESDMIVNFDYELIIDGETYDSYEGAEMDMDGAVFITEGVVEAFAGKTIGEEFTVDLVIPSDFSETEIAGKEAQLIVTVNSNYVPSELNDEYVQRVYSYMGLSTVEEYKEMYKEAIIFQKVYQIAWPKVLDNINVESYDSEEMESTVKSDMESLEASAVDAGYTWEGYLEEEGVTEEELKEEYEEQYKDEVKFMLARDYIVEQEGISYTEEEFSAEVMKSMKAYGMETEEEFFETMASVGYEEEYFRDNMLTTKVLEFVCDNIVIVPDVEEETTTAATE